MNWIISDLLMFGCSVIMYVAVRKSALDKLPPQYNNLATFAVPFVVFAAASLILRPSFNLTTTQWLEIVGTGIGLAYVGSALSMRSLAIAPNPGYSLVISKSYVVMTSLLAVPLFGARLTLSAILAIVLIVGCSALIIINPRRNKAAGNASWAPLAIGSFLCWGFLSLVAKHLLSQGVATVVFLTGLFAVVMICIMLEMWYRQIRFGLVSERIGSFLTIGLAATGFNYFNFYTIGIAPNVGYVNATNAASIGAVTIVSAVLFKDELTRQKLLGVTGIIAGLLLLFIWK
jgi:drug/metabolite transporter (DMT)-like permease